MKISIRVYGIARPALYHTATEEQLGRLESLADISSVDTVVIRSAALDPPYHVHVVLALPGPDICAAAADCTFAAALGKVVKKLEQQIVARKFRRLERCKSDLRMRGDVRGCFDNFAANARMARLVSSR